MSPGPEPLVEAAARLDGNSMRTRLWVLRTWMDLDRSNDTLDAIDEMSRSGETGPEVDYLYGMAFARRALNHLSQGVTDASIQMNFMDATEHLKRALAASPKRFSDGHLSLATAASPSGSCHRVSCVCLL